MLNLSRLFGFKERYELPGIDIVRTYSRDSGLLETPFRGRYLMTVGLINEVVRIADFPDNVWISIKIRNDNTMKIKTHKVEGRA